MQSNATTTLDQDQSKCSDLEVADYVNVGDVQLYYVLHPSIGVPKARILLAGPFATERPRRYISWVRWARYLAIHGYEVLRFDYRACGESTGNFEEVGFNDWEEDLKTFCNWLGSRTPQCPLVLHGLGMGALLADRIFSNGIGEVLLMWHPPKSGRDMLYQQLRLRLAHDFVLPPTERRTRDQYVQDLDGGALVEVEGYHWTRRLWTEGCQYVLTARDPDSGSGQTPIRPWRVGKLDTLAAHMFGGVGPNPLREAGASVKLQLVNPDLTSTFDVQEAWLAESLLRLESM